MATATSKLPDTPSGDKAWLAFSRAVCIWVAVIFVGLATLQGIVFQLMPPGWKISESAATFGDMFGAINALTSALAFALLLVTLRMQAAELKEQREQFQKMADAQTSSEEKMLLQTYLNALTLESTNDFDNDRPEGSFSTRLNVMVLKLKFGRRAAWVRQCIEADLLGQVRPQPPDFEACARVEQNMKYWRILTHYLDCTASGDPSDEAAVIFCRKMAPLFEGVYWQSIPKSTLKGDFEPLVAQVKKLQDATTPQATHSAAQQVAPTLEPIKIKFAAIVNAICYPPCLQETA